MKGNVFIVEDDQDLLGFYKILLKLKGFNLWGAATNGEAAIEAFRNRESDPDVIILDYRLPGCSGLEVAREILALDPAMSIIFCTADYSILDDVRQLGISRFKKKPFPNEMLIQNVEEAIAERRGRPAP